MWDSRVFLFLQCLLVLMCIDSLQSAYSQEISVSISQLTDESKVVVRGKSQSIRSEWNSNRTFIWSFVDFTILDAVKGQKFLEKKTRIEIMIPGGVVDNIAQRSSDEVVFRRGEEALVFLNTKIYRDREYFHVTRLLQGKLSIRDDKVEGKPISEVIQKIRGMIRE